MFLTKQQLDDHLRQDVPCQVRVLSEEESLCITYEQEQQLRKRARKGKGKDDERWVSIFRMIFPDVPEHQIPSPCKNNPSAIPRRNKEVLINVDDWRNRS